MLSTTRILRCNNVHLITMSASANDLGILYHCHLYHQLLIDLISGEGKQNIKEDKTSLAIKLFFPYDTESFKNGSIRAA